MLYKNTSSASYRNASAAEESFRLRLRLHSAFEAIAFLLDIPEVVIFDFRLRARSMPNENARDERVGIGSAPVVTRERALEFAAHGHLVPWWRAHCHRNLISTSA